MTLADAITAVEQSQSAYTTAATQTQNDQAAAAAIQTKLDAANQQVAEDQTAQDAAASAFNAAIDQLVQIAQAAKVPVTTAPADASTNGSIGTTTITQQPAA